MSRLDSFIRRMMAQRDCINLVALLIRDTPGPVLEFGLGNGRTYDHLREVFADREIFVFDRECYAHPDCVPDAEHFFEGEFTETMAQAPALIGARAAFAHCDFGTANDVLNVEVGAYMATALVPLVRPGGLVACSTALDNPAWTELPLRPPAPPDRYYLYQTAAD